MEAIRKCARLVDLLREAQALVDEIRKDHGDDCECRWCLDKSSAVNAVFRYGDGLKFQLQVFGDLIDGDIPRWELEEQQSPPADSPLYVRS